MTSHAVAAIGEPTSPQDHSIPRPPMRLVEEYPSSEADPYPTQDQRILDLSPEVRLSLHHASRAIPSGFRPLWKDVIPFLQVLRRPAFKPLPYVAVKHAIHKSVHVYIASEHQLDDVSRSRNRSQGRAHVQATPCPRASLNRVVDHPEVEP